MKEWERVCARPGVFLNMKIFIKSASPLIYSFENIIWGGVSEEHRKFRKLRTSQTRDRVEYEAGHVEN